jgi:hypothetical protein
MTLKKIRLELARTPDHPEGSTTCGYEFSAPLDASGKLEPKHWSHDKAQCTVRRFWDGAEDEHGLLVHRQAKWAFSYRPGEEDDEPIFRFDKHCFVTGEYVSVTEHDGIERPFRVASVQ